MQTAFEEVQEMKMNGKKEIMFYSFNPRMIPDTVKSIPVVRRLEPRAPDDVPESTEKKKKPKLEEMPKKRKSMSVPKKRRPKKKNADLCQIESESKHIEIEEGKPASEQLADDESLDR